MTCYSHHPSSYHHTYGKHLRLCHNSHNCNDLIHIFSHSLSPNSPFCIFRIVQSLCCSGHNYHLGMFHYKYFPMFHKYMNHILQCLSGMIRYSYPNSCVHTTIPTCRFHIYSMFCLKSFDTNLIFYSFLFRMIRYSNHPSNLNHKNCMLQNFCHSNH